MIKDAWRKRHASSCLRAKGDMQEGRRGAREEEEGRREALRGRLTTSRRERERESDAHTCVPVSQDGAVASSQCLVLFCRGCESRKADSSADGEDEQTLLHLSDIQQTRVNSRRRLHSKQRLAFVPHKDASVSQDADTSQRVRGTCIRSILSGTAPRAECLPATHPEQSDQQDDGTEDRESRQGD